MSIPITQEQEAILRTPLPNFTSARIAECRNMIEKVIAALADDAAPLSYETLLRESETRNDISKALNRQTIEFRNAFLDLYDACINALEVCQQLHEATSTMVLEQFSE